MAGDSSLTEGEEFVLQLHPHWKTLLRPFFILIVTLAAALALLILLPAKADPPVVRIIIGANALLLSIVFFAVPIARWRTTSYELTTRRLRLRSGIVARSGRDFPLIRISDVSSQHGLMDRILGWGKLIVESAGEHGQLVLNDIPHVQRVQSTLFQLVEDEQSRLARDQG